ncbi:MAG: DegT/DnrJ/EryC1/StrS family aminotransferase [Thermoleophilia bacterium]
MDGNQDNSRIEVNGAGDAATNEAVPLLDLEIIHDGIGDELRQAFARVLASGRFILGPEVEKFEREMAAYCGTAHAVGVASGSDALYLSLRALDIGPGDEVITTPFSFIATAECIAQAGAQPVFADIDPATFNISPDAVADAITERTRAIIPVHLFGLPADMKKLSAIAARRGLAVIEDTAQALGAVTGGRKAGSISDAGALSFFPSKNLGCLGDGGMVLTASDETAARLRSLRAHGSTRKYHSEELGINSRLDALQAALLRVKLARLDEWNALRWRNAQLYDSLLAGVETVRPPGAGDGSSGSHVYHQYTVRLRKRDAVKQRLDEMGIGNAVYYPLPLHLQPAFAGLGYRPGDFPAAEAACREVLSLPVGPELDPDQVQRVAAAVIQAAGRKDER